jgi:hypothetical protein
MARVGGTISNKMQERDNRFVGEGFMPLYYFHCRDDSGRYTETWGVDVADLDAAFDVAVACLQAIPSEDATVIHPSVEVEDEEGRVVATVPFTMAAPPHAGHRS